MRVDRRTLIFSATFTLPFVRRAGISSSEATPPRSSTDDPPSGPRDCPAENATARCQSNSEGPQQLRPCRPLAHGPRLRSPATWSVDPPVDARNSGELGEHPLHLEQKHRHPGLPRAAAELRVLRKPAREEPCHVRGDDHSVYRPQRRADAGLKISGRGHRLPIRARSPQGRGRSPRLATLARLGADLAVMRIPPEHRNGPKPLAHNPNGLTSGFCGFGERNCSGASGRARVPPPRIFWGGGGGGGYAVAGCWGGALGRRALGQSYRSPYFSGERRLEVAGPAA